MDYQFVSNESGLSHISISSSDYSLISNPLINKGMAFTEQERTDFNLHGILPPGVMTIEDQKIRSLTALQSKATVLEKYIYLRELQDSNETLFYYFITHYITDCLPIIYTPGVGDGCVYFSHIYRRPKGLYISYPCRDRIDQMLAHPRFAETEVIVVSDGERILGLGDQGAGGMGIPIGKLSLYTACAGIHPRTTLPILLDTGTNNSELLKDPLYIGWRHERMRGNEYDEFLDNFVKAVKRRFPNVLLQWEDLAQNNAASILERYRNQLCSFNDDIQGTAAVTIGTLLTAIKTANIKSTDLRIVILGAGSAGTGIASFITNTLIEAGLSREESSRRVYLFDLKGLLTKESTHLNSIQKQFAQPKPSWNSSTLLDVIKNVKPNLLIGVSGQGGAFTEEIVREMAKHSPRPIIFPLSNPTSKSEATPEDLLAWTNSSAIIGTGSPFQAVTKNGKPFRIDQTNNSYIFPGVGLGLIAVKATRVTDGMFMAAAKALAECSPSKNDPEDNLLPSLSHIREVSFKVAIAVAKEAIREGFSTCPEKEIESLIRRKMWTPGYLPYRKV